MKFNGIDPLLPEQRMFSPQVPDAVVHTDVKTAFIKLMRLKEREHQKQEQIITMNMLENGKKVYGPSCMFIQICLPLCFWRTFSCCS